MMQVNPHQKLAETREGIRQLKAAGVEVPEEAYEIEALCEMACGSFRMPSMELLDWFAGQALAGLVACDTGDDSGVWNKDDEGMVDAVVTAFAKTSYQLAAAMLAERKRRMEGGAA